MEYLEFIEKVIERGIAGAIRDYTKPEQKDQLEGSIAGFNACRGKQPGELQEVYNEAAEYSSPLNFIKEDANTLKWFQCYRMEVEWVLNCVSAVMANQGLPPLLSWLPTARAVMNVAEIVGVSDNFVNLN